MSRSLRVGAVLVGLVVLAALVSRVYTPWPPNRVDFLHRLAPPSPAHPLGTDQFGRDLLSRLMVGAQHALAVGLVSVSIGLGGGLVLGVTAGYAGGFWDAVLSLVVELLYAFPALLLALLLATAWGPGTLSSMVAVGLSSIPSFARVARASVMATRSLPYVEAARAAGATPWQVVRRHVVPNILPPLLVQASYGFGSALLAEAALSYLGLGTQPPHPSWGRMLREGQSFVALSPYPVLFSGTAIALSVLGFNLLGDGLRDLLDPHRHHPGLRRRPARRRGATP